MKYKIILRKVIVVIILILTILFVLYKAFYFCLEGGLGGRAQYYSLKTFYYLANRKDIPAGEFVIDLQQGFDFANKNSLDTVRYTGILIGGWGKDGQTKDFHVALDTPFINVTPFDYFKVTIINGDDKFIINHARNVRVNFKEYEELGLRAKHPTMQGVSSIIIYLRNTSGSDYDSVFARYQELKSMFDSSSLGKNSIKNYTSKTNSELSAAWKKGKFIFAISLYKNEKNRYHNVISIWDENG